MGAVLAAVIYKFLETANSNAKPATEKSAPVKVIPSAAKTTAHSKKNSKKKK